MKPRPASGGLVYSTEAGRMCPTCRKPIATCVCASKGSAPAGDGIVRVSRETKGRGGKAVTVVRGLALDAASLVKIAQQLKSTCGSGGTVKDGVIEVQGEHCDKVIALLKAQGHAAKRAGG
jgi:translation initiation factor 1